MPEIAPLEAPDLDPSKFVDETIRSVYSEKLGMNIRFGPVTILEILKSEEIEDANERVLHLSWVMFKKAYPEMTWERYNNLRRDVLTEIVKTITDSTDFRQGLSSDTSPSTPDTRT